MSRKALSKHIIHPFEPIYDMQSRVLILGSFPSAVSRDVGFYYGNVRNRFWQVLCMLFEANTDLIKEKESKKQFLLSHHIALWDIVQECDICKSSDSTMSNVKINDLSLILSQAQIMAIFCNGKKTYELFMQFFSKESQIKINNKDVFYLPSTSPANVNYSTSKLIEHWAIVREYALVT